MSPLKIAVTISLAVVVTVGGIYFRKVRSAADPSSGISSSRAPSEPAHGQQSTPAPAGVKPPHQKHYGLLTATNWEAQVLKSKVPVLVLFSAEWSGPCRISRPVLAQIADEFGDRIRVGTLDVDENEGIPTRYNVRAVPTWLLFKEGQVRDQRIGAVGKSEVHKMLVRYVSSQ